MSISLENCCVFDGTHEQLITNACVVVEGNRIVDLCNTRPKGDVQRLDCKNRIVMPGLIDAHVHVCAPTFSFYNNDRMPASLIAAHAVTTLEGMLMRGFTTVRDAGGADSGLALAIQRKVIRGPRLFFAGKAISQTGGHGDMRPSDVREPCACSGYSGSISVVADGADAVRAAVREELRQGADQIKIFVSGGVSSPTDPIWMEQFSDAEITAAVEEARTRRKYVMAHCHTDSAVRRCANLGVRTIEHGTHIEPETAKILADKDMYVVPTLSVLDILGEHGPNLGLPADSLQKMEGVRQRMEESIAVCAQHGVKLGLGTDILGHHYQNLQGGELALRARIQKPIDVLRSATTVNAAILQRPGDLGCISPGALADLIVLEGDPFQDISLFRDPLTNVCLVMKDGEILRNHLQGPGSGR